MKDPVNISLHDLYVQVAARKRRSSIITGALVALVVVGMYSVLYVQIT